MWPNFTTVKYNSKISIIYHQIKISKRYNEQLFSKKAVLKNFAIFTEKYLRWSLFLNKNAGLQSWNFIKRGFSKGFFLWILPTLLEREPGTGVSCEFSEISKNTFSCRTPLVTASNCHLYCNSRYYHSSSEAYLEPCQISMIEFFWENS